MKDCMKLAIIGLMLLLIGSTAYAKKEKGWNKTDKEIKKAAVKSAEKKEVKKTEKKIKGEAGKKIQKAEKKHTEETGEENKAWHENLFGFMKGKDHKQQLEALDKKAVQLEAKYTKKISSLEDKLATAQEADDTKKAEKLEKQIAKTKKDYEKKLNNMETSRNKILTKVAEGE